MDDDELLVINSAWPGTTITGEPGIVSGHMSVNAEPDGSTLLSLAVGNSHGPPEEAQYVEFVMSPEQTDALAHALLTRPRHT